MGKAYLFETPLREDAAQKFKWMFIENQHVYRPLSWFLFLPVTLCATKDPWSILCLEEQITFLLRDNNYPMSFLQNCEQALTKEPAENNFSGFVVLPYIQGVSKKIGHILKQQKVKVAYKPQLTINSLFPCLKQLDHSDHQKSGILYKISCPQCHCVYHGQKERSLKTRTVELKKAVAALTRTQKFKAMFTFLAIIWTLKMWRSLVLNPITMSNFSF